MNLLSHVLTRQLRIIAVIVSLGFAPLTGSALPVQNTPAQAKPGPPPAKLAVSPGILEVQLGSKPIVEAMRLINLGDREASVRVSVVPWDLDENNRVRLQDTNEQSLDQWMVFNPSAFTVPPHSEQTVRFSIRPRVRPDDGEHRAMVYFEEQQPETGPRVQVLFRLGVAVYAYAGDTERNGVVHAVDVAADSQYLSAAFDVSSTGNAHIRLDGQYAVWALDAFPGVARVALLPGMDEDGFSPPTPILLAGELPTLPVLGGSRRQVMLSTLHGLPPGRYVMGVVGNIERQTLRQALEFSVPVVSGDPVAGQQRP